MIELGKNAKNIAGQRFGKLVAVSPVERRNKKIYWECQCDCGTTCVVSRNNLTSGHSKSCGCSQHALGITRNKTHGLSQTRLYSIFSGIHGRCSEGTGRNRNRYYYRGIRVCPEWSGENGLQNFIDWSLENGYKDGLTIDRIDVNGNYEPSNCRWSTIKQQCNNRTTTKWLTFRGETKTMAEWADSIGMKHNTLHNRLKNGWSIEDALSKPVRGQERCSQLHLMNLIN